MFLPACEAGGETSGEEVSSGERIEAEMPLPRKASFSVSRPNSCEFERDTAVIGIVEGKVEKGQKRPKSEIRTGWRAIFIGLLLIPPNAYWIASGEATSTTVSLFFNVIFILFVLLLINLSIKRILPNVALNQGELLIIYVMLSISSGIAGLDMMRVLMGEKRRFHLLNVRRRQQRQLLRVLSLLRNHKDRLLRMCPAMELLASYSRSRFINERSL